MLKVSHIAPKLLRDLGTPATIRWPNEVPFDQQPARTLLTNTSISQRKAFIAGAVVNQTIALLPATAEAIQGAKLVVGGREFSIVSVVEIGGFGATAAYQEATLS